MKIVTGSSYWYLFALLLAFLAVASKTTEAQDDDRISFDRFPHFTATLHANLNGFGRQTFSPSISSGINYEGRYFVFDGQVSYDTARMTNDNAQDNKKGHQRSAAVTAMGRLPNGWLAGARFSGGQTSTTNYTKSVWRASAGGGKDFLLSDTSFRITAFYTFPFSDRSNGLQGPHIGFIIPSPVTRHHFYFTEEMTIGFLHATITDPTNKELTRTQMNDREHSASVSFGVMFKF